MMTFSQIITDARKSVLDNEVGGRSSVNGSGGGAGHGAEEVDGGGDDNDEYDHYDVASVAASFAGVNDDDAAVGESVGRAGPGGGQIDPATREHNERMSRRLMSGNQHKEPIRCELCGESFAVPMAYHMMTTHPGCGQDSGGRGYAGNGAYRPGWSGPCGENGIAWYLLCERCRGDHMKRSKSGPGPIRSRKTAAVVRRPCASASAAGGPVANDTNNCKPKGEY